MWQVPSLSIAAQALLLGIALRAGLDLPSRLVASMLATVAGAFALQVYLRHHRFEVSDSRLLERIEHELDISVQVRVGEVHTVYPNGPANERPALLEGERHAPWLARFPSSRAWVALQTIFIAVAVLATIWVGLSASGS